MNTTSTNISILHRSSRRINRSATSVAVSRAGVRNATVVPFLGLGNREVQCPQRNHPISHIITPYPLLTTPIYSFNHISSPRTHPPATGTTGSCTNIGVTDVSSDAVLSRPISTTTHSSSLPTEALFRPRHPFKLATFNVRTLMRIGQQAGLARTLETLAIDVCCLQETRIQDSSTIIRLTPPSNQSVMFHLRLSGDPEAQASGLAGVGVALSERAEAALIDWIPVDSRLCAVRLRGSCKISSRRQERRNLFVVSAYAPTDCSSDAVKDTFYAKLHDLLRKAKRGEVVILAGDMNARVGRLSSNEAQLGGPFGLDTCRSENGERLLTLCSEHRLFLASTNFRRSNCRYATWRPPSSNQPLTQIDHIAISHKWRGCIQDCRSYWSTSLDSDHALVCSKLSMCFGGRSNRKIPKRLDCDKLSQPACLTAFQNTLAEKLETTPPSNINLHWSLVQNALHSAGLASCGLTSRVATPWISAESLRLLDARRSIPVGGEHNEARLVMRRALNLSLRNDREIWWNERASEMERAAALGNSRKLFRLIRTTGRKALGVSEAICEVDGELIVNQQRRLVRWAEHFKGQFNCPPASVASVAVSAQVVWSVSTDPPSEAEIRKEIQNLGRHKAPGSDSLPPALFKDGGTILVRELHVLFSKVWSTEQVPSSWGESIVVPIFKKGPRNDCANHRGISLIPVASKLLASIILRRLYTTREEHTREEQAGFRAGRGCIDQISTLRQLLEHRHTFQRPTIVVFLDIRAAFDSIDRSALWNCLLRNGVPEKYVTILRELYSHTSGRVRAYGQLSSPFAVSSGVRQGCPISPFLFNFAIDDVLQRALHGLEDGGVELLPGNRVLDLEYADDIALLGDNVESVQHALNRLAIEVSKYGMCFAPSKCKVLRQDWQGPAPSITLCGDELESVESFKYLGSVIAADGGVGEEISSRIAKARLAFANLRHLWRRHDVRLSLKGRVYNATVRSVLLYGCETWPLRAEDANRLSVFDHRCLRNIARVRWEHRVSNDEVRRRVLGTDNRSVKELTALHRLRWLGHVLRMPVHRLPYRALFARAGQGWKKRRGGQAMTWRRSMKKLTSSLASVGSVRLPGWGPRDDDCRWLETLSVMAQNRNQWRECCLVCLKNSRSQ